MASPIKGLRNLQKRLKDLPEEIQDKADIYFTGKAEDIRRDAQSFAPVDHGFLKGGISAITNNYLQKTIVSNVNYSAYVEFGTGPHVRIPRGLEAFAAQFKGKKPGNSKAQPFLFPAYFKNLRPRQVEKDLKKIIEKR
jgi:HK97 gp10 family phage protein